MTALIFPSTDLCIRLNFNQMMEHGGALPISVICVNYPQYLLNLNNARRSFIDALGKQTSSQLSVQSQILADTPENMHLKCGLISSLLHGFSVCCNFKTGSWD